MTSAVAQAWVGTLLNQASNGKIFPRPEQRSDFVLPAQFSSAPSSSAASTLAKTNFNSETATLCDQCPQKKLDNDAPLRDVADGDLELALTHGQGTDTVAQVISQAQDKLSKESSALSSANGDGEPIIVGWYGNSDPENPRN